jgi:hypothetical protein
MGGHSDWDVARAYSAEILHGATLQALQPVAENCCLTHFQPLKRDVVDAHGMGDLQMTSARVELSSHRV